MRAVDNFPKFEMASSLLSLILVPGEPLLNTRGS